MKKKTDKECKMSQISQKKVTNWWKSNKRVKKSEKSHKKWQTSQKKVIN